MRKYDQLPNVWINRHETQQEHSNKPFGSRTAMTSDNLRLCLIFLYIPTFCKINCLITVSRHTISLKKHTNLMLFNANLGIPKEQQNFSGLLLRLHNGESILDDWKVEGVDAVNIDKLRSLNAPVAKIHAVHTISNEAKKANYDVAHRP
ncbi:hypothetical protein RhiirA1_450028 [Rhizophagus irregularis]|uniref:Uncharacterized protein n=1 Tax=Rhizophagus irregularis TaxID=588596 RepID=A0A2N0SFS8_9GLOM|nr:hypothetical protein RhiirA1_450028 [Rhizophagus irregularis]